MNLSENRKNGLLVNRPAEFPQRNRGPLTFFSPFLFAVLSRTLTAKSQSLSRHTEIAKTNSRHTNLSDVLRQMLYDYGFGTDSRGRKIEEEKPRRNTALIPAGHRRFLHFLSRIQKRRKRTCETEGCTARHSEPGEAAQLEKMLNSVADAADRWPHSTDFGRESCEKSRETGVRERSTGAGNRTCKGNSGIRNSPLSVL